MRAYDDIKLKYPNLKATQIKAAYLLSKGKKQTNIAKEVDVIPTTIWKWKQREDFTALYKEFCEQDLMNIGGLYNKATGRLNDLLEREDIQDKDLIAAIKLMNGEYHKLMERMDKIDGPKEDTHKDALDVLADILSKDK